MKKINLINIALMLLSFSTTAFATNLEDQLQTAQSLYDKRDSVNQAETLSIVNSIISQSNGVLKYKALVLGASASWWQAKAHTANKNTRIQIYLNGIAYAQKAIELNPNISSGYLWRAFNTGEYGLEIGILKGILQGRLKQMKEDLNTVPTKLTVTGQAGDLDQNYGARRVLGKLYAKLAIVPGNYYKGLALLKSAYEQGQHSLNYIFYAEALAQGNEEEQALAKQVLSEVLTMDPAKFDPTSLGELNFNLAYARKIQACLETINIRYCLAKIQ